MRCFGFSNLPLGAVTVTSVVSSRSNIEHIGSALIVEANSSYRTCVQPPSSIPISLRES